MFTHPVGKTVKYTGAVFEAGKKIATRVSLELVFLLAYIFLLSHFSIKLSKTLIFTAEYSFIRHK